jgi:hypothetical protein
MKIIKNARPTITGDEEKFTGTVFVDAIQSPNE